MNLENVDTDLISFEEQSSVSGRLRLVDAMMMDCCKSTQLISRYSKLSNALSYHLKSGGKRVRAKIALEVAKKLSISFELAIMIAATCELFHNASLIHDDIQDKDTERRGSDSVWLKYGEETAICLGDLMMSSAYGVLADIISQTNNPSILTLTHQTIARTIYGQSGDLASDVSSMSLHDYCEIAAAKSGPLIGLPVSIALNAKKIEHDPSVVAKAASEVGVAYQLLNDLNDWHDSRHLKANGSREVNAVLIVSSNHLKTKGIDAVKILAKEKTNDAIINANKVPFGAGEPLVTLAKQLNFMLSE